MFNKLNLKSIVIVAGFFLCALSTPSFGLIEVRDFSPQGEVNGAKQATISFTSDMVKLGEVDAASPVEVSCPAEGKGRWGDTKTWTYHLARALKTGERCQFTLKQGLKALNHEIVKATSPFEFYVGGPAISRIQPAESSVEEDQVFIVDTNAPLKPNTVIAHAWCETEGVGERIPVRLLTQMELKLALNSIDQNEAKTTIGLSCLRKLPSGQKMKLVWGKGIESDSGGITVKNDERTYKVRPAFKVVFTCDREKPTAPCSPLSDLRLNFSDLINIKDAEKIQLVSNVDEFSSRDVSPERRKDLVAKNERLFYLKNVLAKEDTLSTVVFKGPFEPNTQFTVKLPENLKDLSGRTLSNAKSFPLKTSVGNAPPLAKFSADFGILEVKEGGVLPVTLRNVESHVGMRVLRATKSTEMLSITRDLFEFERQTKDVKVHKTKLAQHSVDENGDLSDENDGGSSDIRTDYNYPRELSFLNNYKNAGESVDMPKLSTTNDFEVLGISLKKPGFYVVEVESKSLGKALLSEVKPMYVRTTALVTDMAVHFKKGTDNSLVWVTSLSKGLPVANANITIFNCSGSKLANGRTDELGTLQFDGKLPNNSECNGADAYYVTAEMGDDFSFVRSDWSKGIEPWRFNVNTWNRIDSPKIHTILDRTLLRAGETVSMKHIARVPTYKGYEYPKKSELPEKMTIELSGGEFTLDIPLTWDSRGVASAKWTIPKDAKLGTYNVKVGSSWRENAQFRVSEFRMPVFSGGVESLQSHLANVTEVPINLSLAYLNGGAANGQTVELTSVLSDATVNFPAYSEFSFYEEASSKKLLNELLVDKKSITLDANGTARFSVPLKSKVTTPAQLRTEMTFADPNGEIQTLYGSTQVWPANMAVGIWIKDWAGLRGSHKVQAVALSLDGKPQAGVNVVINGTRTWQYVHRKRVIGGFYSYETDDNKVDLGKLCEGKTDKLGMFDCQVTVKEAGDVQLFAQVKDVDGGVAKASSGFYVGDEEYELFGQNDEDRIELVPEKREYMPGDVARIQVHSPFYKATALISVERESIIKTYVQPLDRHDQLISIPIEKEWGPNVFVSVLVVRGRVEEVPWYTFFTWGWLHPIDWWDARKQSVTPPTATVDLSRPAYKFGLTEIGVGNDGVKLKVEVTADKSSYKPRDKATIKVKVLLPDGKPAPDGSEVAVAVVDQALLELAGNSTWDLLDDMQQKHAYLVETATAQMQVVGKRHFGKKALSTGGGGGNASLGREIFDTLLYWNPRVTLDKAGMATMVVPLNDSLTAFKVVAIADVNAGLFGTGETEISSKQAMQIISGLPPMVREGDFYHAMITVRNATSSAKKLRINAKAGTQDLASQNVTLTANASQEVNWEIKTPDNVDNLPWQIEVLDEAGQVQDRIRFTQKVQERTPVTVQQSSFLRLDKAYQIPTSLPVGAIPGKGGITVQLTAKLANQVVGIEQYFKEYPYSCLEQKVSIATGLNDKVRWNDIVNNLSSYQDAEGFVQYFPGMNNGSESLTAYVLTMAYENNVKLPPSVQAKMQQALLAFVEGRSKGSNWYWGKNQYKNERKLMALAALSYTGAVSAHELTAFEFDPLKMPTTTLIDWLTILKHVPQADASAERIALINQELHNRLQNVSGKLVFTTESQDDWWWAMVNGESNATRLMALLMDEPSWKADMPGLLRGALMRQNKGHWETTIANAWGRVAMQKFGSRFESDVVTGKTTAKLDSEVKTYGWSAVKGDKSAINVGKNESEATLYMPWSASNKTPILNLGHQGTGQPWVNLMVSAAVPSTKKENGYKITRKITAISQKSSGVWTRGDVLRVRIDVDSDQDMNWVAISDPIPGGASIMGNTMRDSAIAQEGENGSSLDSVDNNNAYPSYTERGLGFFRAYYQYTPKGHFWYEYTMRLNNVGEFNLPPTRVEAMYAPDVFGQLPNDNMTVK